MESSRWSALYHNCNIEVVSYVNMVPGCLPHMASSMDCVLHLSHLVVCNYMCFTAVGIVYILYICGSLVPLSEPVFCEYVSFYNVADFPFFFFFFFFFSFSILCRSVCFRIFFFS